MAIDSATRTLFVFGGKHVSARSSSAAEATDVTQYSGLFAFDLVSRSWSHLLCVSLILVPPPEVLMARTWTAAATRPKGTRTAPRASSAEQATQ